MARIVVVGSVAQDEVITLRQPLREGCHLEAAGTDLRLGGGGANVAIPLVRAGHHVVLVSPVGSDEVGEWLLDQLGTAGVDLAGVVRTGGASTRSVVLVDPRGERTILNVNRCREAGPPLRLRDLGGEAVYVRTRETDLRSLLEEVADRATLIAHVPPLAPLARPAHVLVGSASDLAPEFLADPWTGGCVVAGERLRWMVVTRGALGAEAFSSSERLTAPAPAVDVVDTTGAGDVFAAGLVHGLVSGHPITRALESAVAWGAASVGGRGLPSRDVILRLCGEGSRGRGGRDSST